jgi:transposase
MLLERFGEPIGNLTPSIKSKDVESQLNESNCCDQCGKMYVSVDQGQEDCCRSAAVKGNDQTNKLDEKTPPGGERVVKALKRNKNIKNPWATAWAMKNRGEI